MGPCRQGCSAWAAETPAWGEPCPDGRSEGCRGSEAGAWRSGPAGRCQRSTVKLASSGQSGAPSPTGSGRSPPWGRGGNRGVARRERASRGRRCGGWGDWDWGDWLPPARSGGARSWRQSEGAWKRVARDGAGPGLGPGAGLGNGLVEPWPLVARLGRGAQGSWSGPGLKAVSAGPRVQALSRNAAGSAAEPDQPAELDQAPGGPPGGSLERPRLPGAGPSQGSRQPSSSSSSQSSFSSTQRPRPPGRGSPPARPPGCGRPLVLEPGLAPATPSTSWRPVANHWSSRWSKRGSRDSGRAPARRSARPSGGPPARRRKERSESGIPPG